MKKLLSLLFICLIPALGHAQTNYDWHDLDTITISQKVNASSVKKVYVHLTSTASPRPDVKDQKKIDKMTEAFKQLSQSFIEAMKKEKGAGDWTYEVTESSQAPSDGILVDACLTYIDWGSGALRTIIGGPAGQMSGNYTINISNAQGMICQIKQRRIHDTSFSSAQGHAVIKAFAGKIADDTMTALKNM